jgi:CubicO group peptidase (beta-lactamase class C family)
MFMAAGAWAGDLRFASPEALGFSSERLNAIDRLYAAKVDKGEMAGIVTLIARHGKIVHFSAVGYADVERKRKMRKDTIFRLYSMSKPIASTALIMLYEEGRFQLDDPLSKYIPEFSNLRVLRNAEGPFDDTVPAEHAPTVHDVLRHTAGFTHCANTDPKDFDALCKEVFGLDVTLAQMMTKLSKAPLRYQPGTRFVYSVGPDIQARLVEVLSGMPYDAFLEQRLFKPLGMKDAGFWLPPDKAQRLAVYYWLKEGKMAPLDEVHGHPAGSVLWEPWSVNSYGVNHKRKGGSFGLVATAEDYWRFAQMLLNGREFNGARIFSPQVVQFMTRDHLNFGKGELPWDGVNFGLGFYTMKDPAAAGFMSSEGTFFFPGLAGTIFWADPKEDLVVVAMIQDHGLATSGFWSQIRALVYGAMINK